MTWRSLTVAEDCSHHLDADGRPAYSARFDDVLKFHAPGLAPVVRGGAAWHITPDGAPAYDQRYRRTFGFYAGLAAVTGDDGWHHITPDGAALYADRYDWCGNYQDGRCTVRRADGTYTHLDHTGRPVYGVGWRYAGDYRGGVAVIQGADGRSTHIDRTGALVHCQWFDDLDVFHKGFARARDGGGWMHVDAHGRPVYARRFAAVEPFYNGQARVETTDGALQIIDEQGATLTELRAPRRPAFARLSSDLVGYWRTEAIAVAVRVGLFDALPGSATDVAERCGLHPDGCHRLLRAMHELELTRLDEDGWVATPAGQYLGRDDRMTLADAALEYAGPLGDAWGALESALRRGRHRPDVFGDVARDPARTRGHHRMLRSYARHDYGPVVEALSVRPGDRVVDAGGGVGVLAERVATRWPTATVTVLERPEVVALADVPSVRWRPGDLFAQWGLTADVVLLARVLHDSDDDDAGRILKQARAALVPGGRVQIVEMLLSDDHPGGALCDLHLLAVTGGRERTADGYRALLRGAGFAPAGVRRTTGLMSVVTGIAE